MLMLGKMSVGVRAIVSPPRMLISSARTAKVYGRRSARRTIHMAFPVRASRLPRRLGRAPKRLGEPGARPRRRRHELRPDGIGHVLPDDRVDGSQGVLVERPCHGRLERSELPGAARAPERDLDAGLIEHPAQREGKDVLAVVLAGEAI